MCIISFFKEGNKFILTHNRDENIYRQTSYDIVKQIKFNKTYYSPIDQKANGTWMFYSEEYVACILNGGEEKPISLKKKYIASRGIILLHLLKYETVLDFARKEGFNGVAPFTIFVLERFSRNTYLIHWDENNVLIKDMTDKKVVTWCSSTIYSKENRNKIIDFLSKNNCFEPSYIERLHYEFKKNKGDLPNDLATTSISQILMNNDEIEMKSCQLS